MKRWLFLLFLFILLPASAIMAQVTVKGVVVDEQKEALIGVSVAVRGSTLGVTTDLDGKYSITVPDGSILTFEYLSMASQSFTITPKMTRLDVVMKSDAQLIEEVVVTAMGVKAEKRKLNFAVSSVNADDILASKPSNFVEALQGRVAGINITTQGGSPNAGTQMQIRSIASINTVQSNEPLFVIDGMSLGSGSGGMAQLNPNDIENITILKGAAASALYGSAGANGVVMITTKSGKKGKTTVNFSNSIQVDNVVRLPKIQRIWMPGANGVTTNKYGIGGWGAEIAGSGMDTYNNAEDFFKTGVLHKHDLSVSAGGENISTLASINYSEQKGVIPNDYLNKMGAYLKTVFDVSPTFSMSFMANIYTSKSRDAATSADVSYASYLGNVYSWPITNDMSNYKKEDGSLNWLYQDPFYTPDAGVSKEDWRVNPYVQRKEDYQKRESTNNIVQATATWKAFKNFELTGRLGYEFANSITDAYTIPRFAKETLSKSELEAISNRDFLGTYDIKDSRSNTYTMNAMARYTYELNKDLNFEFILGSEAKISKTISGLKGGNEFNIPGFYSIKNIMNSTIPADEYSNIGRFRKVGFFGEVRADYKGIASLSITGRNDQASRLYIGNNSYFYPSVTAGLTFSELLGVSNEVFNFGKIRANYAKVGKDPYNSYLFNSKYSQRPKFPDGGYGKDPTISTALPSLKPEMMKSWEIGLDLRFFNNKTRLDMAYYSTSVDNQIVTARVSPTSGDIQRTMNQGEIKNHGIEISVDQDIIRNKDFTWVGNVNFTLNRSEVLNLPESITQIPNTSARAGNDLMVAAVLGQPVTAIIGRDYERTKDGRVICNADGTPIINASTTALIGDREPDFRMGFSSNFAYKEWSLSFLLDLRVGGDVVNATARDLYSNGMARRLEKYRNKEIVFDGVVKQADGTYAKNTTPIILNQTNVTEYFVRASSNFIEDVSFLRLSHVTVGYSFKKLLKKQNILKDLNLSVTGRNLFLLTNYSGSDPQVNFDNSGGVGSMGIDNMNVPSTRSFNVTLNATF